MSPDQRFGLIITAIGVIFVMLSAVMGLLVKWGMNWGRMTSQIEELVKDVKTLTENSDQRLTWLERQRQQRNRLP